MRHHHRSLGLAAALLAAATIGQVSGLQVIQTSSAAPPKPELRESNGALTPPPAGGDHARRPFRHQANDPKDDVLTLRYSDRLRALAGIDDNGKAIYRKYDGPVVRLKARVSKVYINQWVLSPSISHDFHYVLLDLPRDQVVPKHPTTHRIRLHHANTAQDLHPQWGLGDTVILVFSEDGRFVDVELATASQRASEGGQRKVTGKQR
ncbi:MAG: hypothetical protein NUV77_25160 [Thermoguttaceae bacterium]|jgi:hypothetical protein|nr:hypothetical protein [Thermoguttaceae bacterium]